MSIIPDQSVPEVPTEKEKRYVTKWVDIHWGLKEFDDDKFFSFEAVTEYIEIIASGHESSYSADAMKEMAYHLHYRMLGIYERINAIIVDTNYRINMKEGEILLDTSSGIKETELIKKARLSSHPEFQAMKRQCALYKVMADFLDRTMKLLNDCSYGYNVTLKNLIREFQMTPK